MYVQGSWGMDKIAWQPSPSFGVRFQSAAAFQCKQKDGEEEAVMTDYQRAVFCLLTPHRHPPLLSLLPSSSLSRPLLHQSQALGSQTSDHDFILYKLQW